MTPPPGGVGPVERLTWIRFTAKAVRVTDDAKVVTFAIVD